MASDEGQVSVIPSDKGGKFGYVPRSRFKAYEALRKKGMTKRQAAMISNAGATKAGRKAMGRKGAKSRKRRGKSRGR